MILDTETTGLYGDIEVVQIAVLAPSGRVLLDALCRPEGPIPRDATGIHGITDAMVRDALPFPYVYTMLERLLVATTRKQVVIYNATYDLNVLLQCCLRHKLPETLFVANGRDGMAEWFQCAMEQYAAYVGDWNDYHGNYRWQKLPSGTHDAAGDCKAVLKLIKQMAAGATSEEWQRIKDAPAAMAEDAKAEVPVLSPAELALADGEDYPF